MTRSKKLLLLGGLYAAQGLPFGFFTQALPVWLRERGASLPVLGLVPLLALPWALKALWAPLVDKHRGGPLGPRRSWILPLQGLQVALLVVAAFVDPAAPLVLGAIVVATNLFSATQDVATDALAVELLAERDRGIGNGLQVAAYRAGMIVGGGALLVGFARLGWTGALLTMAGLVALVSLPVVFSTEPPARVAVAVPSASPLAALRRLARRPGALSWLVALFVFKAGEAAASSMIKPFLVDRGLSLPDIGWILGSSGFAAGLVGSLAGGALADAVPRGRAFLVVGVLQAAGIAAWALPASSSSSFACLVALSAVEHLFAGMATAVLFTRMMDLCEPETAATDYTAQASVVVLSTGLFSWLGGVSAAALGYAPHFLLAAFLSLLGTLAVVRRARPLHPTEIAS